ncbi:hypothetical protein GWK47_018873 [Chionoecetes opilio]|uniref:Uncharacterized protein n=1 Tax=Chionoecetes opilio TaxID=41210 RepID=A0A8J5CG96_CHIOP|nr:hypothetical protein GWK47_018873 [Chionoecetes opilio]
MREEETKVASGGGRCRIPALKSHAPTRDSKLPEVALHKTLSLDTPLPHPVATRPLAPLTAPPPHTVAQMADSQGLRKSGKPPGVLRRGQGVGRLRGRARGTTRLSTSVTDSGSSGSSRGQFSVDEESNESVKVSNRAKPSSRYSSVRARIQVNRGGR